MQIVFAILAGVFGLIIVAVMLTVILVPLFKGIGWLVSHIFAFVGGMIKDSLRLVGAIITAVVFSLLVVLNVLIFRWSASAHFGRAFSAEIAAGASSIYRLAIGHPARLLGLNSLVDGIENRVPQAVAAAPTRDKPSRRTGQFENYKIIGSLPGGGSGSKLYIAEPDDIKLAAFARSGQEDVEQVVIKSFSLRDGSSLPQIVRESRSLDAAKKLGLVLDHELTPERFFYVMRYVPGESLGLVTQHLHAASPSEGLSNPNLGKALGYVEGLLATLRRYHDGGLWHKDVKPDNIIVHGGSAYLVDFGLITPLRSAMTLTTHGTEYFRDPEMVRMALKGVKVHEVDGARFDVYAAGAVLYSVVENSFPAHGGLSQVSKRCPDALRWIVRRAMTEYDKRYPTASAMLADVAYLRNAADPFAVKPAELPSMRDGAPVPAEPVVEVQDEELKYNYERPRRADRPAAPAAVGPAAAAKLAAATAAASAAASVGRVKPKLRVTGWWSGKYRLEDDPSRDRGQGAKGFVASINAGRGMAGLDQVEQELDSLMGDVDEQISAAVGARRHSPARPAGGANRPASEQLANARARAADRRARARDRMNRHRAGRAGRKHASGVNVGVAASLFVFLLFCLAAMGFLVTSAIDRESSSRNLVIEGGSDGRVTVSEGGTAVTTGGDGLISASSTSTVEGDVPTPAQPAPPLLAELEGRVLVACSDTSSLATNEQAMAVVRGGLQSMQSLGLDVVSTLLGEASEDAIDLEVQAKKTLGTRPLDSDEAEQDLTEWLTNKTDIDMLVWIDTQAGQPRVYLLGTPEAMAGISPDLHRLIEKNFSWEG